MVDEKRQYHPGVGIDIGTMNLVSARQTVDGKTVMNRVRDAFIDLDPEVKKSLRMSKVSYVEKGGQLVVIGDSALTLANLFKREVRRPLARGVISASEIDAQEILSLLVHNVLGDPVSPGEHCFFSVPASPVDDLDQDVLYHRAVFEKILAEHGYTPHAMNEAMAIVYSQCSGDGFSGLSISFGSGMCNVALAYQTVEGMSFSLARGGDWIDNHAAKAVGSTASRMCTIKEKGIELTKPEGRDQEAIAMFIRHLVTYCLDNIAVQFKKVQSSIDLPDPVPFIVSGGTTKAGGFMDLFKEEFETAVKKRGFPIKVSEIRQARDPMTAVAEGLLVLSNEEHADD